MTRHPRLLAAVDDTRPGSLSNRFRARRFRAFEAFAETLPRPLRLIDIGGTVDYWEARGWAGRDDVHITLVNLTAQPSPYRNIRSDVGDATDLQYEDGAFHLAFSNSVIEHVGRDRQALMAAEVRRVAEHYWVQTPNYWFPMEPHYLIPGWQFLPRRTRVAVLQRRRVGQLGHTPDRTQAEAVIDGTVLLSRRNLSRLFPDATLNPERVGLVKSWTAVS